MMAVVEEPEELRCVDSAIASVIEDIGSALILKEEQRTAIKAFVDGKDVFAVLPTGFGKTLIVAGSRFETTEGQNATISFDIDEVQKATEVRITFRQDNKEKPVVIARRPWIYDEAPPAGVSLRVEEGRVNVTIQHVNISRNSGVYRARAFFGKKVSEVKATLVVIEASFSSTKAPPHTSTPKPPDSSDLLWLCALIPVAIIISGVVYFCKHKRARITYIYSV
ncbi:hypothetical protein DPX16_1057 [Anabarilius grahami]|uniref:Uncharacterized protein n=1 Tax=Anabarilius grahami TaxID=495550 RepID=A0A3N0YLQ4_ANAGA|nr:hypothetical protein DPX16_1057 [Anabarilius grahami]